LIKALKIVGWALPTLQLLNLFFKTYSNRIPYDTPRGNKFNKEYEVYSQQFLRENFGEEESFNPEVLPSAYLRDFHKKSSALEVLQNWKSPPS
jgi:hypothetical protein